MDEQLDRQVDEQLLRRLNRQLRAIKLMLGFFFVMLIVVLAILGFVAYKVIMFTQQVTSKIDKIQSQASSIEQKAAGNLDFKTQVCSNKSLSSLFGSSSDVCK